MAQFVLAFVLAPCVAFGAFRAFAKLAPDLDFVQALKAGNTAAGVLLGGMLIGTALVVRQALFPSISGLQSQLVGGVTFMAALRATGLIVGYSALVFALAVIGISLATRIFLRLTDDLDEFAEIAAGNVAVAVAVASVIVVMSLFLADGAGALLSAVVPYPKIGAIEVLGGP